MKAITRFLCKLLGCCAPAVRLRFTLDGAQFSVEGVSLEVSLNNEQTITATVKPVTAHGNPAPIDGTVSFTTDPADAVTLEQQDATTTKITPATGFVGAVQINATFDADLGEGVRNIVASGALNITAPEAVSAEIVFGEPQG